MIDPYQQFIHTSRYARWSQNNNRRETWEETVDRYIDFMDKYLKVKYNYKITGKELVSIRNSIINQEVLPSMRAIMTAGPALEKSAVAAYNCSYITVDSIKAFDEAMFILMNGTGLGFSVESQYVSKLPTVQMDLEDSDHIIVVADSREGWAKSLRALITLLYAGEIPKWDTSKVRKSGEKLKTFGGRASGPGPLENLFKFIIKIFVTAKGRKLSSLDCHDIMCKIGEVVVAGSVRRSALISLSDLNDSEMSRAKNGQFWNEHPERSMANNSAVFHVKPDVVTFLREWNSLIESGTGERGILNRRAASLQANKWGRRPEEYQYGLNPCGEIILRSQEFCNLSSVPVKGNETIDQLKDKVEKATVLGTWQACIDNFHYLRKEWKTNAEEERLLGVSLSGIFSHPVLNGSEGLEKTAEWLEELRLHARKINDDLSKKLGINSSAAITCIKPEGNSSQLTGTSSGIHPWHSQYYIRTVRSDVKDPLGRFLKDTGIPCEPDLMKPEVSEVFSFPVAAPEGALTRGDLTAVEHLNLWLTYKKFWCDHNPSITVNVKSDEWLDVGKWVYDNFDDVLGVSFLPYTDHVYKQAPYQEITKKQYDELAGKLPKDIEWSLLSFYEQDDSNIANSKELSCSAATGSCEVVDLNA